MNIQLGLCDPPDPIYLYVGQGEENGRSYLWYQYDIDAQTQHPVFQRGLTGYLAELRITTKEYKGRENHKLDVVMQCDRIYIIRSGLDTNFSKTLLLALDTIPDFKNPLTIGVAPGEETVVFGRVYDAATGNRYKAEWTPDANWLETIVRIQEKLGQKTATLQSESGVVEMLYQNVSTTPLKTANSAVKNTNPEHNAIIKAIRLKTGHPAEQIVDWCQQYNASSPAELTPELCHRLAENLALSWGRAKFRAPELCENSYRGKVSILTAGGMSLEDAIASWIDSVQGVPVARH